MSSIDERVVQMRFDNQQFEQGAKQSMGTLDKLKNALTFGKASKELQDFQNQSNRFNLGGISNALSTVSVSFSNFEIMGLRVLSNIADSAYRTGTRLVKSLSVDNISAGWKKFEDKTTSVATLISQGYDMKTVEEQLSRLNWFTDETSYNFTDMVSNISKFTATGKNLEESVNAMEGIATWASLSGQNAAKASSAMYQLSQAMSAGVMRKEDYKSIQNVSMDTQEFRKHALDAGVALGTLKKNADGTYQSIVKGIGKVKSFNINQFADHLTQDAWFTSDVMMKVFGEYGAAVDQLYEYTKEHGGTASDAIEALGDKVDAFGLKAFESAQEARTFTDVLDSVKDAVSTGWMNTFELIFGNYEEAKALWTDLANELYDVFAAGAEERNALLKGWKEDGGRTKLVESFWNAWNGVMNVISMVKESFREIFPATTVENLKAITDKIHELTDSFNNLFRLPDNYKDILKFGTDESKDTINTISKRISNLDKTLRGIFSLIDIVKMGFSAIAQLGIRLIKSLLPVGDSLLDISGSFGDWAINLRDTIKETGFFEDIIETLGPIIDKAGSVIIWVINGIKKAFSAVRGIFKPFNEEVTETADTVQEKWSPLTSVVGFISKLFTRLGQIFTGLQPVFEAVGKALGTAWDNLHEKIMGGLANFDASKGLNLVNGGLFAVLLAALTNFTKKLKNIVPSIDPKKGLVGTLVDAIKEIKSAFLGGGGGEEKDFSDGLVKMAIAIGILAGSLFLVSTIDTGKLTGSILAIGSLIVMLEKMVEKMSMLNSSSSIDASKGGGIFGKIFGFFSQKTSAQTDLLKTAGAIVAMSIAIGVLAGAVFALSKLPFKSLAKGLIGVGALLAMITAVAWAMSKMEGRLVKGAGGLILVAVAVRVLVGAVAKLGEMEVDKMVNGLIGVGALLAELAIFSIFADKINLRTGVALIALAASLLIIADAVKAFGSMDASEGGELAVGLSAIAAILMGFVVFSQTVKSRGILKSAVALMIMAASLHVIGAAIKSLGKLDDDTITRGAGGLAGALLAIALTATVLGSIKGTGKAAISIVLISGALLILAAAFKVMASIPYTSLVKVLLGFAGAMVVIGVAAAVLGPLTLSILGLSAALLGIGAGIMLAGLGLSALSAGILALGGSLLIAGPMMVNGIATTILAVLNACWVLIPKFVEVGLSVILNICTGIYNMLPEIVTVAVLIVLKFLLTLGQLIPLIVMVGIQFIVSFINGMALAIRDNSESIVMAVGNLLSSIVYAVMTAVQLIAEQIPLIGGWVSDGIQGIKNSIDDTFSEEEMAKITERGMNGAANGIKAAEASVGEATSGLGSFSIEEFLGQIPIFQGAAEDFSISGVDAMLGTETDWTEAGELLGLDGIDGAQQADLKGAFATIAEDGSAGFVNAMAGKEDDAYTAAYNYTQAAVRGGRAGMKERSPSRAFFEIGEYGDEGFIGGLLNLKDRVGDTAAGVGEFAVNSLSKTFGNIKDLIMGDLDGTISPRITPIMDLSNVQNGANAINGMFGNRSMLLAATNGMQFENNRLAHMNAIEATTTNADVVAALGLLRGDVNNLNDSFSNTAVVLDSGALVGATAKQMDNALGRFKVLKGRGI